VSRQPHRRWLRACGIFVAGRNLVAVGIVLPNAAAAVVAPARKGSPMPIRFAATLNAFNRGVEDLKPTTAVSIIEDWETALAEIDIPGTKGIARDLGALRKQLESAAPDSERVLAIIARLGDAVTKIAGRADSNGEKLANLGTALTESGNAQQDEEEDTVAAANPRRRKAA
jgi:hypothetical protein